DIGVGVGLRRKHFDPALAELDTPSAASPDWFEVLPENFFPFGGKPRAVIGQLVRAEMPLVGHSVSLSIAGPDPLDMRFLDGVARFCEQASLRWYSDHLTLSMADAYYYQDLIPSPFSDAALNHVCERIRQVRRALPVPFALENASYYLQMPGSHLSEAEFVARVVRESGCGLLLDVNNVYVNAENHGYDARAFIGAMPAEQIVQIHLAGHKVLADGMRFDTHGGPVSDEVWQLFEDTIAAIGPVATQVEWDNNIPSWERLKAEATLAREALARGVARFESDRLTLPDDGELARPKTHATPDVSLDRFYTLTAKALDGRLPVAAASAGLGLTSHGAQRLGFYRSLVHEHATQIVSKVYDQLKIALGEARFEMLAEAYAASHPMRQFEWNATAAAFPSFLEARGDVPPWAPELATAEWQWFATYTHIAEVDDDAKALSINPTLTWVQFTHRVVAWMLNDDGTRGDAPAVGEESILMYRDPATHRTKLIPAGPRVLLAMKCAMEGAPDGADVALIEAVLTEAKATGILVGSIPRL
ncbi:MAG: hypothetical protein ACI9MR_000389, partial [Myxococcota bacterium]